MGVAADARKRFQISSVFLSLIRLDFPIARIMKPKA